MRKGVANIGEMNDQIVPLEHCRNRGFVAGAHGGIDARAHAEPARDDLAALGPTEHRHENLCDRHVEQPASASAQAVFPDLSDDV